MLIPARVSDSPGLGYRDGSEDTRRDWVGRVRQQQKRIRVGAIGFCVSWVLVLAFLGMLPWMTQRARSPQRLEQRLQAVMPHGNAHLGAEYYNIASALVRGRGFSDPFVVESGPTAWMPPLLVWIQASLIWMFDGDRYLVICAVVALKTLLLAACGVFMVRQSRRASGAWIASGVFALGVMTNYTACFAFTHDGWLILAGVMATLWGLVRLGNQLAKDSLRWRSVIGWGCLGGLIALSSPIAGFTWAVCTTALLAPRSPRRWLVAGVLSVLVITPWAIRNRSVLGKWIPVKSNLFFEIDQSLALDQDGLLDWQTMSSHPYHAGAEQDAYVAMGEIAYLETKQERFARQFKTDRGGFFRRVKNRLIGATLWPAGFSEFGMVSAALPLRWLTYPLPLFSLWVLLLCGLLRFGPRLTSMQRWTITIYLVYLTPYVMFSYYPRYGFPLLIIKFLLCYWAIQRVIGWRRAARSSISPPAGPIHPTREPPISPSEPEVPVDYDSGSVWGPSTRLSH